MWTAQERRPDIMKRLIDSGANLNVRDENGRTALTYTVTANDTTGLKLLLDAKADANADSGYALMLAIIRGDLDVVGTLLEAGANPSVRYEYDYKGDGEWPLAAATRLENEAVRSEMVWILLEAGADVIGDAGAAALLGAVEQDDQRMVERLLTAGVDISPCFGSECKSEAQRDLGITALCIAVAHGDTALVRVLIAAGADVNGADPTSNMGSVGNRPLTIAADTNGDAAMVRLLLDAGADINLQDILRRTALWHAASRDNLEIAQFLVESGADLNTPDTFGITPVIRAVESGAEKVLQFLLASGADVDAPRLVGVRTALTVAVADENEALVALLLEAGADPSRPGEDGRTALTVALGNKDIVVVRLLLEAGAGVEAGSLSQITPLAVAVVLRSTVERAMVLVFSGGGTTSDGASSGRIVVEGNSITFESYRPHTPEKWSIGLFLTVSGSLVVDIAASPVTVQGTLVGYAFDVTVDASTDPPTYGGTITVSGTAFDVATLGDD